MRNLFEELDQKFELYTKQSKRNFNSVLRNYSNSVRRPFAQIKNDGSNFTIKQIKKGNLRPILPIGIIDNTVSNFQSQKKEMLQAGIDSSLFLEIQEQVLSEAIEKVEQAKLNFCDARIKELKSIKEKWEKDNPSFADPLQESLRLQRLTAEASLVSDKIAGEKLTKLVSGQIHMDQYEVGLLISKLPENERLNRLPQINNSLSKLPDRWQYENKEKVDKILQNIEGVLNKLPGEIPFQNAEGQAIAGSVNVGTLFNKYTIDQNELLTKSFVEMFAV